MVAVTFDSFGILEQILSYVQVQDLVKATEVNRRFKLAGRSNVLWKAACGTLWDARKGMVDLGEEMPLFWRSSFSNEVIDCMSVRQIRSLFNHVLLREKKLQLQNCLEKSEMSNLLKSYRDEVVELPFRFTDLWFGAYASSVLDSQRVRITKEELCSPHGFDVHFKILQDEVRDEADLAELQPYEGHPGVMLFHHSVSYFNPNGDFDMEMKDPDSHHPTDLRWRLERRTVQVGPYPYLVIKRQPDWGWKLENVHVVMLFRDTRAKYSRRPR